jgi:hypothetical protein
MILTKATIAFAAVIALAPQGGSETLLLTYGREKLKATTLDVYPVDRSNPIGGMPIVKRGISISASLQQSPGFAQLINGLLDAPSGERKSGSVIYLDREGKEVMREAFENPSEPIVEFPGATTSGPFDASGQVTVHFTSGLYEESRRGVAVSTRPSVHPLPIPAILTKLTLSLPGKKGEPVIIRPIEVHAFKLTKADAGRGLRPESDQITFDLPAAAEKQLARFANEQELDAQLSYGPIGTLQFRTGKVKDIRTMPDGRLAPKTIRVTLEFKKNYVGHVTLIKQ